jgi:hypothetical protein
MAGDLLVDDPEKCQQYAASGKVLVLLCHRSHTCGHERAAAPSQAYRCILHTHCKWVAVLVDSCNPRLFPCQPPRGGWEGSILKDVSYRMVVEGSAVFESAVRIHIAVAAYEAAY